jgi:hypothetical protein
MNFFNVCRGLAVTLCVVVSSDTAQAAPRQIFAIPITGQMSDGNPAFGQASGMSDGKGLFWVQVPAGAYCSGSWNVRDPNPTIVVPVRCDDGAKGEAVIARQPGFMSGSAIVALSNKKRGQFVFGNMTFEQTFGNGGSARTR